MAKLNDWFISISLGSKQIKEYVCESNYRASVDFPDGSGEDYNNTAVDDTGIEYGCGGNDSFMDGGGLGSGDGDGDGDVKGSGLGLESILKDEHRYEDLI